MAADPSHPSPIRLDYAVPAADLREYFSLFYDLAIDAASFTDHERAQHAQLRFILPPGQAEYRFVDGTVQSVPRFHVLGPTTGPIRVRVTGPLAGFGVGVTPAGWAVLIGNDASTMLNRAIDAGDLLRLGAARVREAGEALAAAQGIAARVAVAEPLLRALIGTGDGSATSFVRQVDHWLAGSPSPEVADLVAACGLSRRHIERRCRALYGTPPKLLARKYRALRAAVALVAGGESLDDVIGRGFYDQSHLIRELKQFTGLTPRQMHADPGVLTQLTIGGRTALGPSIGALIRES